MREIRQIVVHCSATPPYMKVDVAMVRGWHLKRGFKDIGYHYLVQRGGLVEVGRPEEQIGAHVEGHNANSIGICMAGGLASNGKTPEPAYTDNQWYALEKLLRDLVARYPKATVLGHRDFPGVRKSCPSFSVKDIFGPMGLPIDPLARSDV